MTPNFRLYVTEQKFVPDFYDRAITHLVSIGNVGEKKPFISHWPKKPMVCRVEFSDVTNMDTPVCFHATAPDENHVNKIINFGNHIKRCLDAGEKVNLLCHCAAGISRSTAAAFVIVNTIKGPGFEQKCLQVIYDARPIMCPNVLVVRLADKIMNVGGKMKEVVEKYNKYAWDISYQT